MAISGINSYWLLEIYAYQYIWFSFTMVIINIVKLGLDRKRKKETSEHDKQINAHEYEQVEFIRRYSLLHQFPF